MSKSRVISAVVAGLLALGAVGASTAPAAADGAWFGFQVGGHGSPSVGFGYSDGYRYAPPPPPVYRYAPPPVYRNEWRPRPIYRAEPRPVRVCEPVWRTRRVEDRWGRVVKVTKVRAEECRVVYR